MGNSVRSTPVPPERPLPCPDGKSGVSGAMLNSTPREPGAKMRRQRVLVVAETGRWAHRSCFYVAPRFACCWQFHN